MGESGMSLDGDIEISLKELSGIMGLIQLRYATKAEDKEEIQEDSITRITSSCVTIARNLPYGL